MSEITDPKHPVSTPVHFNDTPSREMGTESRVKRHPESLHVAVQPAGAEARARSPINHRSIEAVRVVLLSLIVSTAVCVTLYETGHLSPKPALVLGVLCSLTGPIFPLTVLLHAFRYRHAPLTRDVFASTFSYLVTGTAFAAVYLMVAAITPHAYTLPNGGSPTFTFGSAFYFSIGTITTTGYGDIAPLGSMARFASCAEMLIGIAYQAFLILLGASLLFAGRLSNVQE